MDRIGYKISLADDKKTKSALVAAENGICFTGLPGVQLKWSEVPEFPKKPRGYRAEMQFHRGTDLYCGDSFYMVVQELQVVGIFMCTDLLVEIAYKPVKGLKILQITYDAYCSLGPLLNDRFVDHGAVAHHFLVEKGMGERKPVEIMG